MNGSADAAAPNNMWWPGSSEPPSLAAAAHSVASSPANAAMPSASSREPEGMKEGRRSQQGGGESVNGEREGDEMEKKLTADGAAAGHPLVRWEWDRRWQRVGGSARRSGDGATP